MRKQKLITLKKLKKNNFSLVLSGGSSLGLAHIGVIKFLEENNLQPSEIVATSMGSIIGSLYALGKTSEDISDIIKNLKMEELFEIKYFQGRIEYKKATTLLKKILRNNKIKDAKIELKIIATNLKNGEEKIFTRKDNVTIYDAVLASSAIPGILAAKIIKKEVYIDGAVSSNLPTEAAEEKNIKLAINVVNQKIKNYKYHNPKKGLINNIITKFKILQRTSHYYMTNQTSKKINQVKKLILIEPNLQRFNSYKIINHEKIIDAGYTETKNYFEKAAKQRKRKRKKSSLEKILSRPIKNTARILKGMKPIE